MMQITPEQDIAINTHDQNLMVMAGAGSGKTYVLVNRYLALLDSNRDWPLNALVAITFTRKAAQEMRDRVRQELEKRHHAAQDESERDCWAGRIASMDSARIDTIHGLCASILRANASEAGVDPRFEVLDEVQAASLLDDSVDVVMQSIVAENDPSLELFSHYDSSVIYRTLKDFIHVDLGDLPLDMFANWEIMLKRNSVALVNRLLEGELLPYVNTWQPNGGWSSGEDKLIGVWEECQRLLSVFFECETYEDRLEILTALSELNINVGYHKFWTEHGMPIALVREPIKRLQEAIKPVFEVLSEVDQHAARLIPLWHRLINRAQAAYRVAKSKEALVDFGDLERLTRELLYRHPAVRARFRQAEFRHLLVDEFQDTNADQWDIVRALADPAKPGSLFIVGDGKQSIYQFRGADVSVFNYARQEIQASGGLTVPLNRSFRAHRPLMDSLNHLFSKVLTRDPDSIVRDYQITLENAMEAAREQPPADLPALEFMLLDKDAYCEHENSGDMCRRWEAYEVGMRLRHMVEVEGRLIYDKHLGQTRPMGYGDAALLFRAMTAVNLYEDVFKAIGLPFVTVSGRGYYNRQEVWDLINLLTALHNPADNLRLAAALRSPLFNLSDDALLALRLVRDENNKRLLLWDALHHPVGVPDDEMPLVEFARECLYRLRGLAGRVTISELLYEILDCTGYLATLTSLPDGARRRGNVEKLLEKAQTSGQVTPGAFSQYLRDMSANEVHEGEALVDVKDAVTLMTIHGSKGLEFPVVALVDLSRKPKSDGSPPVMYTPQYGLTCKVRLPEEDKLVGCYAHELACRLHKLREEAERKRLLYVAATRAQDYLILSGHVEQVEGKQDEDTGDPVWKSEGWMKTLLELFQPDGFSARPGTTVRSVEGWGRVSMNLSVHPPASDAYWAGGRNSKILWDSPYVQAGEMLFGEAQEPVLLHPVKVRRDSIVRHLTATQIADLGGAEFDTRYREKFRRSVLHDATTPVADVTNRKQEVSQRIIGEIVHGALGWWRFPSEYDNLEGVLKSYAWELGVVDAGQQKYAVQEARKLLLRTMNSDVYRWLEGAKRIYRELPFVFKNEGRTIHGVLDVLFQRADDSWGVIDYKTSSVADYKAGMTSALREHARRYHLQVGVYAAAVKEQLGGIAPDVYIHYIRYGETVPVYAGEWELALGKLEHAIGNLLDESDWVN